MTVLFIAILTVCLLITNNSYQKRQAEIELTCEWIEMNGGSFKRIDHYWQQYLPDLLNKKISGKVVSVDLSYAFLDDLTPLQSLKYLESLRLDHTAIQSTEGLEKLKTLEKLSLSHFSKDSIPELNQLEELIELNLAHSSIQELPDLKKLDKLRTIDISQTSYLNSEDLLQKVHSTSVKIIKNN